MESAFRTTWTCFVLALAVLALCVGAFAQGAGELSGQVTDSTGAVVSGVEIKLTDSATGQVYTTVTTPAGTYLFPALPIVGSYTLDLASKGFKSVKVHNIVVSTGTVTTRDVKLEVGAITDQVTVEGGGSQLVQTEDASLSQNVDSNVWINMPLETRSSNEFIALLPGAEPAANADLGTDRGAAINGTRSGSGNFMVEGFDNNDQGLGGGGSLVGPGGSNTTISPDAIEEYRVIEGTPPAEFGKSGGFVTDTVLKGGTNSWHGSLFEYNRIQDLAANSWFSNAVGAQDHLIRNQFGGSVGGPVVKDKTFFYFTTEFHRLRTDSPLTANTFTSDFVNFVNTGAFETFQETNTTAVNPNPPAGTTPPVGGICFALTGATCPGALSGSATAGPVYTAMASAQNPVLCTSTAANCPVAGQSNVGQGLYPGLIAGGIYYPVPVYGQVTVPQGLSTDQARYSVKFDHKLSSKDQLSATYLYDNADSVEPYAGGNETFGPTLYVHGRAQNAGVTWSHTFSPTILNQARMAYVRHTANFPGDPKVAGMADSFPVLDEPSVNFGNADNLPQLFTENEFLYSDSLSVAKGKHNFKGGFEFRRTRNGSSFDVVKNGLNGMMDTEDLVTDGAFTNQLEQFLTGSTSTIYGSVAYSEASLNPTTGQLPVYYRGYRANEVAMYVQDDWRVNPRLTLNLGVRWEYFGPPQNFQPGIDANFYQGTPVTPIPEATGNPFYPVNSPYYALFASGQVQQRNHDLWNKDLNNFGPRFGFSYDALGNQKLVVRGGFGISYDRLFNNIFENIRFNPPYFAIGLLGSPLFGLTGGTAGEPISPTQTSALINYPFTGTSQFAAVPLTPSIRAMDQNLVTPYYEQAHLGFQYQIGKNMVWESNYVGTFGHKLTDIEGRGNFNGETACSGDSYAAGTPCFNAGFPNGFSSGPINPLYGTIGFRTNCCDSNYHAFQTTLRRRFSSGLEFNLNYTFAKAMDDVSDTFTTKNAGANAYPTDSSDPHLDYGPADFNVKHRIVGSFVYDLPFAKANRWLGGWNVSGIVSYQSGADFSIINSSVDSNADTQFNDRAVYLGPGNITNAINHHVSPATGYLNPSQAYWGSLNGPTTADQTGVPCVANGGLWCNTGEMQRNSLTGPGFFNTDLGFSKKFKINERAAFRFEGNFFNMFNHPNFLPPDLVNGGANLNSPSTFGKSAATFNNQETGGPRITQLAVRFDF